jgi:hypothetical protein
MHLGVREFAAAISTAGLIFCCSCEKHHLGEDPPFQKEKAGESKPADENSGASEERSTSPSAKISPTPAQFFPETSPSP